ncbi:MAG: carotenoid oxygenase family protein [Nostoc sp. DedQUE12b]|uniref:carotenoid oxygenase family protein n=1 Tax=Nostoc sp. DedQUE12b TaxID=3075398 RepID=UPI002AD27C53|nr:carotenoid oxygenase family protein [Nostoc sp. DedQUE12b]MDZ8090216.1 carotenoid oxygenase family protein [Nostoc sp. DedQUE12b]
MNHKIPEPRFPEAAMTSSRQEISNLPMNVIYGDVPADLSGHTFIIAPVGSVASGGLPNPNATHIFNGDGMIYRFDWQGGQVTVKTKLARTPCYYADQATFKNPTYRSHQFRDHGLLRFSPSLGLRDEVDIAFLAFNTAKDSQERLMITYDAGRPYEIDTNSLEVVTPVGGNTEWKSFLPLPYPFSPVLSTSHPAFDGYTNEVFLVNYGRSLSNFLESARFIYDLEQLPQEFEQLLSAIAQLLDNNSLRIPLGMFSKFSQSFSQLLIGWIEKLLGTAMPDFVHLMRWDGVGKLQHWELILPDGSPVRIEQSMHQLAITKDYVVLMDTSLKIGPEQILNNPFPNSLETERLLRQLLTRSQQPNSPIYIVRRADLKPDVTTVVVRPALIPLETVHFLTDYENPDGQITMHTAHLCATDIAEWVRKYDISKFDAPKSAPLRLGGMLSNGQMDVGRLGRYQIDGETGQIQDAKVIYDTRRHWGIGFYACQEKLVSGLPPQRIDNIYWQSLGFWPELLTEFIYNLYEEYPYRAVPLKELMQREEAFHNRPSSLFRVDTIKMEVADFYDAPSGYFISSPQFVPRLNSNGSSTDGYIVCTVFGGNNNEIWIFQADQLGAGPICKLSHPQLDFGFTMHTAWLSAIAPRTSSYDIPVRQDYESLLKQPAIQQLFAEAVYPHFQ